MDPEHIIAEIESLEHIFAVPDTRPLSASDLAAANRRHDDALAHSPWFSAVASVRRLLPFLKRLTVYTYSLFLYLPS